MTMIFQRVFVTATLLLALCAFPGCSSSEPEAGKMDGGAMDKGKMGGAMMEPGKMDGGAMDKGKMEGTPK